MSDIMLWALMKGTNELVNIDDVIKSEGKEFVCVGCGSDVFSRQGEVNRHHFAHYAGTICERAGECIIHRLIKEVLYKERKVMLPDGTVVEFILVDKESWIDDMRIDAVLTIEDSRKMAVEVVVTCDLGDTKLQRLRRMGYEVLVFDCSLMDRDTCWNELVQWVTGSNEDRTLHEPEVEGAVTSSVVGLDWFNLAMIIGGVVLAFFLIRAFVRAFVDRNRRQRSRRYKYPKMRFAYARH
ncbi:MAG: hypothetical protein ABUM51_00545 [Bacteroidota bacterium]